MSMSTVIDGLPQGQDVAYHHFSASEPDPDSGMSDGDAGDAPQATNLLVQDSRICTEHLQPGRPGPVFSAGTSF